MSSSDDGCSARADVLAVDLPDAESQPASEVAREVIDSLSSPVALALDRRNEERMKSAGSCGEALPHLLRTQG